LISSSFVPPEPIRRLRTHTRYRRHLAQARTSQKQRVEKLLDDGHLAWLPGISRRMIFGPGRVLKARLTAGSQAASGRARRD
jgi:transposase